MVRPVLVGAALRSVGTVVLSGIVQLHSMIVLMLLVSFNRLNQTFIFELSMFLEVFLNLNISDSFKMSFLMF